MGFTVASYNVLATAYIRAEWYPFTPAERLDPAQRVPALVEHVARLDADVICLQEVEDETFAALDRRLGPLGYAGHRLMKGHAKPDGCATFFRTDAFRAVTVEGVEYDDGDAERPSSGHVVQLLVLEAGDRTLGVANTHLKWDPPGRPAEARLGLRQVRQLVRERESHESTGWVVCGDLNVEEESDVVRALRDVGFEFSHASGAQRPTCNPNGHAKMIDFIFHDGALRATPSDLPVIEDDTPLPGPDQPSDHVAVLATLDWRDA